MIQPSKKRTISRIIIIKLIKNKPRTREKFKTTQSKHIKNYGNWKITEGWGSGEEHVAKV